MTMTHKRGRAIMRGLNRTNRREFERGLWLYRGDDGDYALRSDGLPKKAKPVDYQSWTSCGITFEDLKLGAIL